MIYTEENFGESLRRAEELRAEYDVTLYEAVKKLGKLFSKLEENGFYGAVVTGQEGMKVFGE